MRIIIVGCGKIGSTLLSALIQEGHDVVGIDSSAQVIEECSNIYDAMYVCGNGADCETLIEAGVQKTEMFISVTSSDELNMLSCFIAKKMGAKHTVARIRNPEYNDKSLSFMKQQLGLSMVINPELMTAKEISNILKFPSAVSIDKFTGRNFEMIELMLKEGSPLDGMKLSELGKKYQAKILICAVCRDDRVYIPDGNFVLQSGDKIGLTASSAEIQKLLRMMGSLQRQSRSIMLLGGSRIALYLAKIMMAAGCSVKIIEKSEARCNEICDILPNAVVICSDGAQQEVLLEEGLRSMDAFVSLTGMDEENILISFFAASQQVPKVVSKVNRRELAAIAGRLGLDCIISPKKIVTDVLTRYARALRNSLGSNVETLYRIMDGKAEALEFNVQQDFKYLQIPLKDMQLKKNILIAGITRGRRTIIPSGDDTIMAGDRVVVVCAGQGMHDLSDIIK